MPPYIRSSSIAVPPSQASINHFTSIPWCARYFNDPAYTAINTPAWVLSENGEDTLFAGTLKTKDTIPIIQAFYKAPQGGGSGNTGNYGEVVTLVQLGSGLNGHPNISHGGALMAILDELMAIPITFYKARSIFTVNFSTDFKKPVPTPSVILCRCALAKIEGRKFHAEGSLEDGEGSIYTKAKGLWLEFKEKL
ncbi:MAG: hypothetical protein MMC33_002596 [Icmadophila ericetorum]|nr:hypothetical protein [Icmadophila ericetorum]